MANGEILRHLTGEDGLQSNQYNFGATFRSSTGLLYFGGINGFNVINPENLKKNSVKPDVTAHVTIAGGRHPEHDGHTVIPRNINSFSVRARCTICHHRYRFYIYDTVIYIKNELDG